jgi:hypothetical protein
MTAPLFASRWYVSALLLLLACCLCSTVAEAQNDVAGAFEGTVTDSRTKRPISGATVRIRNVRKGLLRTLTTDTEGRFFQALLEPDIYEISVQKSPEYNPATIRQTIFTNQTNRAIPLPVQLTPALAVVQPTPETTGTPQPGASPTPTPTQVANQQDQGGDNSVASFFNRTDGRRGDAFTEKEVSTLPLGSSTLTRTFDELALLVPGVSPPPQTLGSVAGPGIGAGVGSAGQFSVNGLRSRSNNFTVDGSDNNDEDIGVRRQGFFSLVPQPIESIKEYQVITLLAPAQFGRNLGGQVNAVSKSGDNEFHGTLYGFFNSSQLNARNFFDTAGGNATSALRSESGQAVLDCTGVSRAACIARNRSINVTNQSGGEDSFTLGQAGFVLGGPIKRNSVFFFLSYERQILNATKEASFAVPTVDQRGAFNSGASGLFQSFNGSEFAFPTTFEGDAIFSLFPFPNNPTGVYGRNTLTQVLPSNARGNVGSGKIDWNFKLNERQQNFAARYNITEDYRDIPVTGGAIFSTLRPRVRTQNFSTYLNSEMGDTVFNSLRLSYGRTRLNFQERRHPSLLASQASPGASFLLNAPLLTNNTLPNDFGARNTGPVLFSLGGTVEQGFSTTISEQVGGNSFFNGLGRIGQVQVAGFSSVGVDVFNFPQDRVDNTYQLADQVTWRIGKHNVSFGTDIRRTELNSDLPRNSRTLLTYNAGPFFEEQPNGDFILRFINPTTLVAAGAPNGAFLSLTPPSGSTIGLRYYQYNFFGQDEFRILPNLSLSFGLRYEYNTPPREVNNRIESNFPLALPQFATGLGQFVDGRTGIFDPDRNNFAPRVSLAWSPKIFPNHPTVIRGGYGLYYDQILGAVVSQSRNVFPGTVTVNTGGFGGGLDAALTRPFTFFNPARGGICFASNATGCTDFRPLVRSGSLNTLNPNVSLAAVLNNFASGVEFPNALSVTLPARQIENAMAHQYSFTWEQELTPNLILSSAYIGTLGRNLLRASTPNFGPNNVIIPFGLEATGCGVTGNDCFVPRFFGIVAPGGFVRPFDDAGAVTIYESRANSNYNAGQFQLRGRFSTSLNFQVSYTLSSTVDDVSDVFDLAGAPALPQNSLTREGERAPSNFDARHRLTYNFIYDFPKPDGESTLYRYIFGGLQIASTGKFQTGQPFTVNSIFDVNLDGNLTDRLDVTHGIIRTGNRRQPLELASGTDTSTLLAQFGADGRVGRNTFRAGNILELDLAIVKNISITERQHLMLRMDVFNFINRANFGIPVRFLEAPGFGQATDTITPGRRIQFALKYSF